jgi:hypothetical protein
LGLFVRRYHGPGEKLFAARNFYSGLEALRIHFESKGIAGISLQDAKWND